MDRRCVWWWVGSALALELQRMTEAPVRFGPMRVNEQNIHRHLLSLAVIVSIRTLRGEQRECPARCSGTKNAPNALTMMRSSPRESEIEGKDDR